MDSNKQDCELFIERDSIIVKKTNELAIKERKIELLQKNLICKQKECIEHEESIRLLKLEIQRIRQEKSLLIKSVDSMIDLRHEIFNLERELKHERIRSRALEELVITPQNVHRWRKLEDTDPNTVELLDQVHMLQKKNLSKAQKMKELQMRLEDKVKEKKWGDQPTSEEFGKMKRSLIAKDDKIKALVAELKLKESLLKEQQKKKPFDLKMSRTSSSLYAEKRKDDNRNCESAPAHSRAYMKLLKAESKDSSKRFLGGGFNLTPKHE